MPKDARFYLDRDYPGLDEVPRHVALTQQEIAVLEDAVSSTDYADVGVPGDAIVQRLKAEYADRKASGMRARAGGATQMERRS